MPLLLDISKSSKRNSRSLPQLAFFVEPFHRMFVINDLNISYPHAEIERVPVSTGNPPPPDLHAS